MTETQSALQKRKSPIIALFIILSVCISKNDIYAVQKGEPVLQYTVSMTEPSTHYFHIDLYCSGWNSDTIDFKMPRWMPGYYQIMNYGSEVKNLTAGYINSKSIPVTKPDENTWRVKVDKNTPFKLGYDLKADRRFVANNFLDTTHGYIVPASTFLYIAGHINAPVTVRVNVNKQWGRIATGLDSVPGKTDEFSASDFDILYDCPLLIGNLEELPQFEINGIKHRFIGFNLGNFDKVEFITKLKKVITAGVDIFGDVPYKQYTFIGIGPGYGGIEHLNNTTVSFNGNGLDKKESMNRMLNFLAHEYFHNYNVKRIRPFELGPFDYEKENRTDLLWVSEGLSVYYEYLMVKRAGLKSDQELYSDFESSINALENNPGRNYQSLIQASYNTWSDGPFGKQGKDAGKTISYYDKGPVVGLILDLSIRNATDNEKSLDDVMRLLYREYYKKRNRGFTDAEFQEACESIAGISLSPEFEYVYTTKELDYNYYLSIAGLKMIEEKSPGRGKRKLSISRLADASPGQSAILRSWLSK